MTTPTSDFYLTLPSNANTSVYPNNGPSGFKFTLPNIYELHGNEWQVGLANLIYPRTWWIGLAPPMNIERVSSPRGILCSDNDDSQYRDERWVPFHVAQGHYETVQNFMKWIRQPLREEFGQSLADQ